MATLKGTDANYVGAGGSGGDILGQSSTDLIGFYGTTAIAQRSGSSQSALPLPRQQVADLALFPQPLSMRLPRSLKKSEPPWWRSV